MTSQKTETKTTATDTVVLSSADFGRYEEIAAMTADPSIRLRYTDTAGVQSEGVGAFSAWSQAWSQHVVSTVQPAESKGLQLKQNSKGGLFIRDASFQEYSEAKQKSYTASLNLPWNTAKALFTNDSMLKKIRDFVSE